MQVARTECRFKRLLDRASPDFAWEVMKLEIHLGTIPEPSMDEVMQLVQLYMTAVEVLESHNDSRYAYFNHKIHSLMMQKQVLAQLHKDSTPPPQEDSLQQARRRELEQKKTQIDLQMYLQKESYNLNTIKEMLQKGEHMKDKKTKEIQKGLSNQNQQLQERIQSRRLRSISKGVDAKKRSISKGKDPKTEFKDRSISKGKDPRARQKEGKYRTEAKYQTKKKEEQ